MPTKIEAHESKVKKGLFKGLLVAVAIAIIGSVTAISFATSGTGIDTSSAYTYTQSGQKAMVLAMEGNG